MPAPRELTFNLDGLDHTSSPAKWAFQANPLTLTATLTADLLEGAASVVAEIFASGVGGLEPLASSTGTEASDVYTFDFATADMAVDMAGLALKTFYLVITALDAEAEELQTLYRGLLELHVNQYSGAPADSSSGNVRLVSAEPDEDTGLYTLSARGLLWDVTLDNVRDAPTNTGVNIRLVSATPDPDTGLYTLTARGLLWDVTLDNARDA